MSSMYSSFYYSSSEESSGDLGRILGKVADVADVRDELFGLSKDSKDEIDATDSKSGLAPIVVESRSEIPETIAEEEESYISFQDENFPEPSFVGQNIILQSRTHSSRLGEGELFTPKSYFSDPGTPKSILLTRSQSNTNTEEMDTLKSIPLTRTHSSRLEEKVRDPGTPKSILSTRSQSNNKAEEPDTFQSIPLTRTHSSRLEGKLSIPLVRTHSSRLEENVDSPKSTRSSRHEGDVGTPKSISLRRSKSSRLGQSTGTPKSASSVRSGSSCLDQNTGTPKSAYSARSKSSRFEPTLDTPKSISSAHSQSSRFEPTLGTPKSISSARSQPSRLEDSAGTPRSIPLVRSQSSLLKESHGTPKNATTLLTQSSPREKPATPKVRTPKAKAFRVRITAEQLDREFYSASHSTQPSMSASIATEETEKVQAKEVTEEQDIPDKQKANDKDPLEELLGTLIPSCYGSNAKCFNEPSTTDMKMPFTIPDIPKHFEHAKCFTKPASNDASFTTIDIPVSFEVMQRTSSPSFLVLSGLEMISIGIAKTDQNNESHGRLEEAIDRWISRINTRVMVGKVSYGNEASVKEGVRLQKLSIETPELLSMPYEDAEKHLPEDQMSLLALLKDKDFSTAADFVSTMIKEDTERYGDLDLTVAIGIQNLAMLCLLTNRLDEAIYHHKRAVEAKRAILGEGEVAILSESLNELAVALHSRGDVEDASIVLKEAVFMHGDMEHPRILSNILNNIGCTMFQSGRPTQALSFLERSLMIQNAAPGESEGAVSAILNQAITKTNTGHTKLFLGHPDDALELFDESMLVLTSVLGEKNETVKSTVETIGKVKVLRAIETYAQTVDTTASF